MIIGVFQVHIRLPMAHSLKEKRGYLKGTIQKLRKKYNVSISEIDGLDNWQSATLGLSSVSNEKKIIESTFRKLIDDLEMTNGIEIEAYEEEYL
jgi:uncharacterized protein YlxP (DUF503 family)